MHEMDLIEFLIKEGHTDIAESIKDYRKNTIKMCVKDVENVIAKGTSKIGGFPDLPPEIPYPTMSGYSCKRGDDTERYEKSAMHLVAQRELEDAAGRDEFFVYDGVDSHPIGKSYIFDVLHFCDGSRNPESFCSDAGENVRL